jgi:hypothetical protein
MADCHYSSSILNINLVTTVSHLLEKNLGPQYLKFDQQQWRKQFFWNEHCEIALK